MSLDTFFEHILLTEQNECRKTRLLQKIKVSIVQCEVKSTTAEEELRKAGSEAEEKEITLTEDKVSAEFERKHEQTTNKLKDELMGLQTDLFKLVEKIRLKHTTEEEKFMKEIMGFNNEFSLKRSNRGVIDNRFDEEMESLRQEYDTLQNDIGCTQENEAILKRLQNQKKSLQMELVELEKIKGVLERQTTEAVTLSKYLQSEKRKVSHMFQTDPSCLQLKKELEMQGEMKQATGGSAFPRSGF